MKFVKFLQTTLVASCVMLGAVNTAQAIDDAIKGVEASEKGDYKTAAKYFSKAVKKGNVKAEFSLGLMYAGGIGVKEDRTKGFKLILSSCRKGHQLACNFIDDFTAKECAKGTQEACNMPKYSK